MPPSSNSRAVRLNAGANYANMIVVAVLGLLINPALATAVGVTAFGVWKACQRFFDFATVADGRATQALKWVIAYHSGRATDAELRRQVGASAVVWVFWLPVVLASVVALTAALPLLIRDTGDVSDETIYLVGAFLAANIVLTGLLFIPDAVLVGTNQGYRSMVVTTVVLVLSNLGMLFAAQHGGGIVSLGAIVVGALFIDGLATYLIARRRITWWGVARPTRVELGAMAKFSGWILGGSLVSKLLLSSELVLLSVLVGAVAVADYTFTSYVLQFALGISLLTASAFTPKIGALFGSGGADSARETVVEVRELTLAIISVVGCFVLLFNGAFVSIWAGPERYMGDQVNAVMVLAFVQLALIRCDSQLQETGLSIRIQVLVGALSAVLGMALGAVFYLGSSQIVAIYLGLILGRMVASVTYPILVNKQFRIARVRIQRVRIIAVLLLLAACFLVSPLVERANLLGVIVEAIVAAALLTPFVLFVLISRSTRAKLLSGLRKR